MTEHHEEKMELSHEPVPGYPRVFVIIVVIAVIHLGFIFIRSLI